MALLGTKSWGVRSFSAENHKSWTGFGTKSWDQPSIRHKFFGSTKYAILVGATCLFILRVHTQDYFIYSGYWIHQLQNLPVTNRPPCQAAACLPRRGQVVVAGPGRQRLRRLCRGCQPTLWKWPTWRNLKTGRHFALINKQPVICCQLFILKYGSCQQFFSYCPDAPCLGIRWQTQGFASIPISKEDWLRRRTRWQVILSNSFNLICKNGNSDTSFKMAGRSHWVLQVLGLVVSSWSGNVLPLYFDFFEDTCTWMFQIQLQVLCHSERHWQTRATFVETIPFGPPCGLRSAWDWGPCA